MAYFFHNSEKGMALRYIIKLVLLLWFFILLIPINTKAKLNDCHFLQNKDSIQCVIGPYPKGEIKLQGVSFNGEKAKNVEIKEFPVEGYESYVVIMVDTSDPDRQEIIKKIGNDLRPVVQNLAEHNSLGFYTFDTRLEKRVPFGEERANVLSELQGLKATGLTTELYRSVIELMSRFERDGGDNRTLLVVSDGKAEDEAFTSEEVIERANEKNVQIYTVAYTREEHPPTSFQNLRKLSQATNGLYFEPQFEPQNYEEFAQDPSSFIDNAKLISVPLQYPVYEKSSNISLTFKVSETSRQLKQTLILPNSVISNKPRYIWWVVGSVLIFLVIIFALGKIFRRRPSGPHFQLIDPGGGQTYNFRGRRATIGKKSENDLTLDNDSVSRFHAQIYYKEPDGFYIADLGSSNGTLVNGTPVTQARIAEGDMIDLGEVRLKFHVG